MVTRWHQTKCLYKEKQHLEKLKLMKLSFAKSFLECNLMKYEVKLEFKTYFHDEDDFYFASVLNRTKLQ